MEGMRKWWLALIFGGVMLLGLVVVLAFGKFSASVFEKWLVAEGALGGAYIAGNVVSKFTVEKKAKKK